MGRVIAQTKVVNLFDEGKTIECGMLVDTGASALFLPRSWKQRLGRFQRSEPVKLQLANQDIVEGEACWPVEIEIEGFRPVSNEVVFVDMMPGSADYEQPTPLLGYVVIKQAQAAVDMVGHRLVPVPYLDLKHSAVIPGNP